MDIELAYSSEGRYYHTFKHITNCMLELDECRHLIQNFEVVKQSILYHDIVYDPIRKDNEQLSADIAYNQLNYDLHLATIVKEMILTTTNHTPNPDLGTDNMYFLDIDLSILGKGFSFVEYERNIRKEYHFVPDDIYYETREKIMRKFMERPSIYFTDFFKEKYEEKARDNLSAWL